MYSVKGNELAVDNEDNNALQGCNVSAISGFEKQAIETASKKIVENKGYSIDNTEDIYNESFPQQENRIACDESNNKQEQQRERDIYGRIKIDSKTNARQFWYYINNVRDELLRTLSPVPLEWKLRRVTMPFTFADLRLRAPVILPPYTKSTRLEINQQISILPIVTPNSAYADVISNRIAIKLNYESDYMLRQQSQLMTVVEDDLRDFIEYIFKLMHRFAIDSPIFSIGFAKKGTLIVQCQLDFGFDYTAATKMLEIVRNIGFEAHYCVPTGALFRIEDPQTTFIFQDFFVNSVVEERIRDYEAQINANRTSESDDGGENKSKDKKIPSLRFDGLLALAHTVNTAAMQDDEKAEVPELANHGIKENDIKEIIRQMDFMHSNEAVEKENGITKDVVTISHPTVEGVIFATAANCTPIWGWFLSNSRVTAMLQRNLFFLYGILWCVAPSDAEWVSEAEISKNSNNIAEFAGTDALKGPTGVSNEGRKNEFTYPNDINNTNYVDNRGYYPEKVQNNYDSNFKNNNDTPGVSYNSNLISTERKKTGVEPEDDIMDYYCKTGAELAIELNRERVSYSQPPPQQVTGAYGYQASGTATGSVVTPEAAVSNLVAEIRGLQSMDARADTDVGASAINQLLIQDDDEDEYAHVVLPNSINNIVNNAADRNASVRKGFQKVAFSRINNSGNKRDVTGVNISPVNNNKSIGVNDVVPSNQQGFGQRYGGGLLPSLSSRVSSYAAVISENSDAILGNGGEPVLPSSPSTGQEPLFSTALATSDGRQTNYGNSINDIGSNKNYSTAASSGGGQGQKRSREVELHHPPQLTERQLRRQNFEKERNEPESSSSFSDFSTSNASGNKTIGQPQKPHFQPQERYELYALRRYGGVPEVEALITKELSSSATMRYFETSRMIERDVQNSLNAASPHMRAWLGVLTNTIDQGDGKGPNQTITFEEPSHSYSSLPYHQLQRHVPDWWKITLMAATVEKIRKPSSSNGARKVDDNQSIDQKVEDKNSDIGKKSDVKSHRQAMIGDDTVIGEKDISPIIDDENDKKQSTNIANRAALEAKTCIDAKDNDVVIENWHPYPNYGEPFTLPAGVKCFLSKTNGLYYFRNVSSSNSSKSSSYKHPVSHREFIPTSQAYLWSAVESVDTDDKWAFDGGDEARKAMNFVRHKYGTKMIPTAPSSSSVSANINTSTSTTASCSNLGAGTSYLNEVTDTYLKALKALVTGGRLELEFPLISYPVFQLQQQQQQQVTQGRKESRCTLTLGDSRLSLYKLLLVFTRCEYVTRYYYDAYERFISFRRTKLESMRIGENDDENNYNEEDGVKESTNSSGGTVKAKHQARSTLGSALDEPRDGKEHGGEAQGGSSLSSNKIPSNLQRFNPKWHPIPANSKEWLVNYLVTMTSAKNPVILSSPVTPFEGDKSGVQPSLASYYSSLRDVNNVLTNTGNIHAVPTLELLVRWLSDQNVRCRCFDDNMIRLCRIRYPDKIFLS